MGATSLTTTLEAAVVNLLTVASRVSARAGPLVALSVLAVAAGFSARAARASLCSLPDLPSCLCFIPIGQWPLLLGELIETAHSTVGKRTSCIQHGGQAYWEIQRHTSPEEGAEALAAEDPGIEANPATAPAAWCTETIAFWAIHGRVPYEDGYYTGRHYPSSFVVGCRSMRNWYQDEEAIGAGARGRWIYGTQLDYDNFEPGVNGPCPGAYQQIMEFDRSDVDGDGDYWSDGAGHSQLIDSMVVWRFRDEDGPVQRIDVHMVEGNVGYGGGSIYSRVIDTRWYYDIVDFTVLAPDESVIDENVKIRGWGINLNEDGTVNYDAGRIRTEVTFAVLPHPHPTGAEDFDADHVAEMVGWYQVTLGDQNVTTNSPLVQTGGQLPTESSPWYIPAGPHPVDPVYIEIDLLAQHPIPVSAMTFEWVDQIPRQFEVWWSGEPVQIQTRSISLPTPPPVVPPGTVLPLPIVLDPATGTGKDIRYVRLSIPNSVLTNTFILHRVHFNFYDPIQENRGGSAPEGDAGATGVGDGGSPRLALAQPVPNPFTWVTQIAFQLSEPGDATLAVYDVRGRLVTIIERGKRDAGEHHAAWNGKDASGREAPAGVYFLRLEQRNAIVTRKMVLLR
jgi:hypothetical protein